MCPKCYNILPVSNKILHDLKCTKERPVELSQENPYTSSAPYNYEYDNFGMRNTTSDYSNLRISNNFNLANELRNSAGSRYYKRNSYMNDDGTTTEFKKETDMSGKEELLEITYDPQGNIIGRKKADGGRSSVKFSFRELQDYSSYDPMDKYNIYEGGNVYVQTVPTTYITYEPVETYSIDYNNVNSNMFGHDFGSRGYSLMNSNINNGKIVNINTNNNLNNQNTNQYFTDYNNTYSNQSNTNNFTYSNENYNTINYNNYFQNSSNDDFTNSNNFNYQNNRSNEQFKCAKVTKLN